jgi:serine/threonine protein kinase
MSTLSVTDAAALWRQMAGALSYVHMHCIVHDDVKPENIMWHGQGRHSVLLDFGAAIFHPGKAPVSFNASGTPAYAPPEYLLRRKGPEGDVWALGVTMLFAMGSVKLPSGAWILPHALEGREEPRREMVSWLAEIDSLRSAVQAQQPLVARMLVADPDLRIESSELVQEIRS